MLLLRLKHNKLCHPCSPCCDSRIIPQHICWRAQRGKRSRPARPGKPGRLTHPALTIMKLYRSNNDGICC
jgi:hypothetical protein